jgi:2-methylcitrate dehydratase PrpD
MDGRDMTARDDDTAAERFAAFAAALDLSQVPGDVVLAGRLHVLDTLGCGLAAHALGAAPYAHAAIAMGGPGRASAIGAGDGVNGASAALANGIQCHALDFDDTHAPSVAHVSAVVTTAALAVGEDLSASLGEVLAAILAGNEITCRVGMPVGDAFHHQGFHPTAICGVFGATAAVGRLAGLDAGRIASALGIAGSMASGLLAFLTDGSDTKRIHPGWMAHAAHVAVALAAGGADGPAAVLEGRKGVYEAFLSRKGVAPATDDLGVHWETPSIAFKPYPACHFLHAAVDAMAAMREREDLDAGAIAAITVFMPQAGIDMVLAPLERKHRPATAYEAKFSAPFALGALLADDRVDVTTFTEPMLGRGDILDLARRVDFERREYPTFPESFPAGVRVVLDDGRVHEEHLPHQRGGARLPMTGGEVREKFHANATLALGDQDAALLADAILGASPSEDLMFLRALRSATAMHVPA